MNREELIAEARAHLERAADAAPKSVRRAILAGEAEDHRLSLVARLASALEQAHTPTETPVKPFDTSPERVNIGADSSYVTPADDERETLAAVIKRVSQKFGGPSLAEFANDPPIRKHYATAEAILAAGFHRADLVELAEAEVAAIEQRVYDEHRNQIAGMAKALVRAGWEAASAGFRRTVQGEPTDAQVEAAITASWGDESWRSWHPAEIRDEMIAMRAALSAAAATQAGENR